MAWPDSYSIVVGGGDMKAGVTSLWYTNTSGNIIYIPNSALAGYDPATVTKVRLVLTGMRLIGPTAGIARNFRIAVQSNLASPYVKHNITVGNLQSVEAFNGSATVTNNIIPSDTTPRDGYIYLEKIAGVFHITSALGASVTGTFVSGSTQMHATNLIHMTGNGPAGTNFRTNGIGLDKLEIRWE